MCPIRLWIFLTYENINDFESVVQLSLGVHYKIMDLLMHTYVTVLAEEDAILNMYFCVGAYFPP